MHNYIWIDADPDLEFDTIEEALMTCCYICGDRLEWDLKVEYSSKHDIPVISGSSFSCGIKYCLRYNPEKLFYKIEIYA